MRGGGGDVAVSGARGAGAVLRTTPVLPQFEALRRLKVADLRGRSRFAGSTDVGHDLVLRLDENGDAPVMPPPDPRRRRPSRGCGVEKVQREITPPKCTGHDEVCKVRVVKKSGPNFGRLFFTCPRQGLRLLPVDAPAAATYLRARDASARTASRRVSSTIDEVGKATLAACDVPPAKVNQDDLMAVNCRAHGGVHDRGVR